MYKKLFGLSLFAFISIFILTSCGAATTSTINETLEKHRLNALTNLEEHVNNKHEALYCFDNWGIIKNLLNNGKTYINMATNEVAVDNVLMETKDQINNVPRRLGDEIIQQIKEDAMDLIYNDDPNLFIEETFFFYYGTFNGNIVVMMHNLRAGYPRQVTYDIFGIRYPNIGQYIRIWSNGNFYRLAYAYETGMLITEDLEKIASIHEEQSSDIFRNRRTWF